jgi:hypothetical protein
MRTHPLWQVRGGVHDGFNAADPSEACNLEGSARLIPYGFPVLPILLALLGGTAPVTATVSRVVVRDEVVMRVPVIRPQIAWPVRWVEKRGPKCIDDRSVIAATLTNESSIDFLLRDRRRIRAKMDSECPTLDFYGGFYLQPENGSICAGRDEIRSRIGGSCRIERFRTMVPKAVK